MKYFRKKPMLNNLKGLFIDPKYQYYVYRLNKVLYGLKQDFRVWYDILTAYLMEHDLSRGGADRTLFIRRIDETITIAQIYVDDIIFSSPVDSLAHDFAECMKQEFEMSMTEELNYFLGLQVKQTDDVLFISQSKYVKNLVKHFGLDSKKHTRTPMSTSVRLGHDPTSKSVDQTLYMSMIGSLLYLTANRPDIAFSVGVCTRFQAVRRIIKYVNGTVEYGIMYSLDSNLDLAGYSDADWAGNADDRKIPLEAVFMLELILLFG